ncbi:histidine phosphatase family protein [Pontibacter sp. H249]|uniref:histidine phosphatase family protein n=1 Tax=Pontibacter sp. H249 TaxID=3133420 RepID=UPI0030BDBBCA
MEASINKSALPKRIFLIRHARPDLPKSGFFSNAAAKQYITDYDAAAVENFILEHETLPYNDVDTVYCSTLPRSQLTAKAIFGDKVQLKVDNVFREFERRIFSLPLIKLPIKLWLVSARVLWFMGFNNRDIETFKEAKHRARQCAETLATDAHLNQTTVLVAHGLLNNFIRKELEQMGWHKTLDEGHGYLSVTLFQQ